MLIRPFIGGLASYVPALPTASKRRAGGTDSARYCYSVRLRHLVMAGKNGLSTTPEIVAELGPGNSLGIGLAALLSGSNSYYAFDVVKYANTKSNLVVFDELVELFKKRVSIPNESEFPTVKPYLEGYEFPAHILTEQRLLFSLEKHRVEAIREALSELGHSNGCERQIIYFAPWDNSDAMKEKSVDMIYSQAVLEHVNELEHTYRMLSRWLKPGGFMSHQIDFKSHEYAAQWNGHWAYSDLVWSFIRGRRPFLLNRQPHATHVNLLARNGFKVVCDQKITTTSGITRRQLSRRFQNLSDEDLVTSSAFMQAVKVSYAGRVRVPSFDRD